MVTVPERTANPYGSEEVTVSARLHVLSRLMGGSTYFRTFLEPDACLPESAQCCHVAAWCCQL